MRVAPAILTALLLVPVAAEAAPKPRKPPSCDIGRDDLGDADPGRSVPGAAGQANATDLDLRGFDFGTGKARFLARLPLMAFHPFDVATPSGRYYELTFRGAHRAERKVWVAVDAAGAVTSTAGTTATVVPGERTGHIDVAGPLAALDLEAGMPLTTFRARSARYGGQDKTGQPSAADPLTADTATSNASYVVGGATCLPVL